MIEEIIDAKAERRTDSERAFGDVDFVGSAPHPEHLEEIAEELDGLSEGLITTGDSHHGHRDEADRIETWRGTD
ncbi:hypothetical protein [Halogranum amylolyticum]|uniref:hypothetical protein n=1 Tax=Halogranum amylolyticum TaxID=660520 RepID=UPI000AB93D07|nr:hypothetical protein [Halogranum amylolyticum]